jgi:hypothetical protein
MKRNNNTPHKFIIDSPQKPLARCLLALLHYHNRANMITMSINYYDTICRLYTLYIIVCIIILFLKTYFNERAQAHATILYTQLELVFLFCYSLARLLGGRPGRQMSNESTSSRSNSSCLKYYSPINDIFANFISTFAVLLAMQMNHVYANVEWVLRLRRELGQPCE